MECELSLGHPNLTSWPCGLLSRFRLGWCHGLALDTKGNQQVHVGGIAMMLHFEGARGDMLRDLLPAAFAKECSDISYVTWNISN
jgi:hypothetical protein